MHLSTIDSPEDNQSDVSESDNDYYEGLTQRLKQLFGREPMIDTDFNPVGEDFQTNK